MAIFAQPNDFAKVFSVEKNQDWEKWFLVIALGIKQEIPF